MNIYGKKVVLRAIEMSDCEMIKGMFNDPTIENLVVGWAFPLSLLSQQKWVEDHCKDQNNFRFVIELPDEGSVGIATLTDIDWKNRSATHGIKLCNSKKMQRGIGTDTVMAIMRYAFDELGLHRLNGSWFDNNIASKNLYKKCGWKEEGIKRECVYKNGKFRDLTIAGILESDYRDMVEKNKYWE